MEKHLEEGILKQKNLLLIEILRNPKEISHSQKKTHIDITHNDNKKEIHQGRSTAAWCCGDAAGSAAFVRAFTGVTGDSNVERLQHAFDLHPQQKIQQSLEIDA